MTYTDPSITYVFENGKLDTAGSDTFVEFDIYAKQNIQNLGYAGGEIIFTYSNSIFGTDVVDSGNITIIPGTVTADTNAYSIAINDTLFKSGAVPPNGGEVWLSIASIGSPYYAIADTLQQLCHVKMKLKHEGNFQVNFDRFFMQNQSDYLSLTSQQYTNVYTGGSLALAASNSSVTLHYVLSGDCSQATSNQIYSATVSIWASAAVSVQNLYAYVDWNKDALAWT